MWSPVEYAAHARDMVRVLGERTTAMLDADDPQFADWDGDAKNVELSYFRADPAAIAQDLAQQTARTASILREVGDRVVGAGGDDPAEVQPPRKSAAIPPQWRATDACSWLKLRRGRRYVPALRGNRSVTMRARRLICRRRVGGRCFQA